MKQEARASSSVYRSMRNPAIVGQLRSMSWAALMPPTGPEDELWTQRCRDYWHLQERLYGLKVSNFTFLYSELEQAISTFAVVLDILPGERRPGYTPEGLQAE